jgi:hypothetical protein
VVEQGTHKPLVASSTLASATNPPDANMTESTKKLFRLAAIDTSEGPLHILWTIDEDGVWVLPWASMRAADQRRLGETIARVGSFANPRMPAEIVELTRGGAEFVQLTPGQAALITRELAAELPVAETA